MWQRAMPGLQAVTGSLSLSGLPPVLQDGSMLTLGGTNSMLSSSMLVDSPGGQVGAQPCLTGHKQTTALLTEGTKPWVLAAAPC